MGVALLDLVETALRVAKQALGNRAGKPDCLAACSLSPDVSRRGIAVVIEARTLDTIVLTLQQPL